MMSNGDGGLTVPRAVPQRNSRNYRPRKKMGRPYKSGKASKYEPIEYRAWFLRLMYNLRDCRLEQDIPAREIRAMGGPNATAVAKLENGYERDMKVSTLFRWCRVMGVSVHEMIP